MDKFFESLQTMFERGEAILRQTTRKLDNNPPLKVSTDWKRDFPEFWDLLFKENDKESEATKTKQPDFLKVVYPDAFCRAIRLTQENRSDVFDWLYFHQATSDVKALDDGKAFTLRWSNTTSGNTVEYTIGPGDYVIERFDCWEYEVYGKTSEDFDRNLIIIKD